MLIKHGDHKHREMKCNRDLVVYLFFFIFFLNVYCKMIVDIQARNL